MTSKLGAPLDGQLGIVAIGRNEGFRLKLCLESLHGFDAPVIYVDSNSSDNSVDVAKEMGVEVLQLDPSKPMNAARARREGFRQLEVDHPELEFIFFVDGDCQVDPDFLRIAQAFLKEHEDIAAVCGRRREQHPEHSIYDRLCDHEWDTPVGECMSVGGDAVYRCSAYREAGEFDPTVAAGEEPELCKRIRDRGWKVWRLDDEMTVHHAGINHLSQWWKRHFRTGYAGYDVERRFNLGLFDRIIKSAFFWGVAAPAVILLAALALAKFVSVGWAIGFVVVAQLGIIVQVWRVARQLRARRYNWSHSMQFGIFTMAAKVPIVFGVIRQVIETAFGRRARLVEYKQPQTPAGSLSPRPRR